MRVWIIQSLSRTLISIECIYHCEINASRSWTALQTVGRCPIVAKTSSDYDAWRVNFCAAVSISGEKSTVMSAPVSCKWSSLCYLRLQKTVCDRNSAHFRTKRKHWSALIDKHDDCQKVYCRDCPLAITSVNRLLKRISAIGIDGAHFASLESMWQSAPANYFVEVMTFFFHRFLFPATIWSNIFTNSNEKKKRPVYYSVYCVYSNFKHFLARISEYLLYVEANPVWMCR